MEQFACPKCLKVLVWEPSQAGQPHICPGCETLIAVPAKPGIPRAKAAEPSRDRWPDDAPLIYDPLPGPQIALGSTRTSKREAWKTARLGLAWCFLGIAAAWIMTLLAVVSRGRLEFGIEVLATAIIVLLFLNGLGLYLSAAAPEGWIWVFAQLSLLGFAGTFLTPFCCLLGNMTEPLAFFWVFAAFAVWTIGYDMYLWAIVIHFRDRSIWAEPKYLAIYQAVLLGTAGCLGSVRTRWLDYDRNELLVLYVMQLIAAAWQLRIIMKVRRLIATRVGL